MGDIGFQASGQCGISFTYDGNLIGTQTYSATALGETYIQAVDNMYAALNTLVDDYFKANPSYQKMSVNYANVGAWPAGPPKLTLYYKIVIENGIYVNGISIIDLPFENLTIPMADSNYEENDNIINFTGYKTSASPKLNLPPTFGETISIIIPSNGSQVNAHSLFIDYGNSIIGTVPFALFNINSASGDFQGYTVIKVNYNNLNPEMSTRIVEFY